MQFHLMLPTKDSLSNKVELLNAAPDLQLTMETKRDDATDSSK